jgi:hypothetical protein
LSGMPEESIENLVVWVISVSFSSDFQR